MTRSALGALPLPPPVPPGKTTGLLRPTAAGAARPLGRRVAGAGHRPTGADGTLAWGSEP